MARRPETAGATPREPSHYDLILVADLDRARLITARSHLLQLCSNMPFDPESRTYEPQALDSLRLFVELRGDSHDRLAGVSILRVNLVAWIAARARPDQYFSTCFRSGGDYPDAEILARGTVATVALDAHQERGDLTPYPTPHGEPVGCAADGRPAIRFEVTLPNRVELVKPGLYEFLVSLTVDGPEGRMIFIVDPEMDVGGTYPP